MAKRDMLHEVARLVMRWQDATEAFDEAVGERYGLSGVERRCLSLLYEGPQTAGAIARATGLTPAAITSLIDRLEARGFVRRTRSPEDRRKVMVETGPEAAKLAERHYIPIGSEGDAMLAGYSEAELAVVRRFLTDAIDVQERHLAKLKG